MAPTAPWGPTGTHSPAGSHTCSAEEQERGHAAAEQVEALHGGCQELPASHCLYLYGGSERGAGQAGWQLPAQPAQMLPSSLLFRSQGALGMGTGTGLSMVTALQHRERLVSGM